MSELTHRSKSFYVKKALEEFFANHEDYLLSIARLEKNNPRITLEEMEKRFNVED